MVTESFHWADGAAEKIIKEKGNKKKYVCAAGITPSGVVHIGNFREIITVDLVSRALKERGKNIRFIYSWDDYDVFRKVPAGFPEQEKLKEQLRKPITEVFDPYHKEESFARFNEVQVEKELPRVGISPEFLYQSKMYISKKYKEGIKTALINKDKIKKVLDKYREEPLRDDWLPITIFDPDTKTDEVEGIKYLGGYKVSYFDKKGTKKEFDFSKDGRCKLLWRVDWPMRWDYEKVDFEPGGKDHSTVGGSYSTAKEIVKEVYNFEAPTYIMYDFIGIKGTGGKISSSVGNVITLKDCLEIYEPELLRWFFTSTKPNKEFFISFDLDVIKNYEDFDRLEREYFEKKLDKKYKRIYELACVDKVPKKLPKRIPFRHLSTMVQIFNYEDIKKRLSIKKSEEAIIKSRINCVRNWLNKYAPDDMVFELQDKPNSVFNTDEKTILKDLANKLKKSNYDEESLSKMLYDLGNESGMDIKEFFKMIYRLLINKEKGPKLAQFLLLVGPEKLIKLVEQL